MHCTAAAQNNNADCKCILSDDCEVHTNIFQLAWMAYNDKALFQQPISDISKTRREGPQMLTMSVAASIQNMSKI